MGNIFFIQAVVPLQDGPTPISCLLAPPPSSIQANQTVQLPPPYMHAVAIMFRRIGLPQRCAWVLVEGMYPLSAHGLQGLVDCVRDMSEGGVRALLPPLYFPAPPHPAASPCNFMECYMYSIRMALCVEMSYLKVDEVPGARHMRARRQNGLINSYPGAAPTRDTLDRGASVTFAFLIATSPEFPEVEAVMASLVAWPAKLHPAAASLIDTAVGVDAVAAATKAARTAAAGDERAAVFISALPMLKALVQPHVHDLTCGLRVCEFMAVARLCLYDTCVHSCLPRPPLAFKVDLNYWPQAVPQILWDRTMAASAAKRRLSLCIKTEVGVVARSGGVDSGLMAAYLRHATSFDHIFLNPGSDRLDVDGNHHLLDLTSPVTVTDCMTKEGLRFQRGWAATLPRDLKSHDEVNEFVAAYLDFLIQHRPGVITRQERKELLAAVVEMLFPTPQLSFNTPAQKRRFPGCCE